MKNCSVDVDTVPDIHHANFTKKWYLKCCGVCLTLLIDTSIGELGTVIVMPYSIFCPF